MIDLTGQKFGRLLALEYRGSSLWLFKCDCGSEKVIPGYDVRKGRIRSCGCLLKEIVHKKNLKPVGESAHTAIYSGIKQSAKIRGLEFNLSQEFVRELTQKPCFYCRQELSNIKKNRFGNGDIKYNGLDRINNHLGYIPTNVVSCCRECNRMKGSLSQDEFIGRCKAIAKKD